MTQEQIEARRSPPASELQLGEYDSEPQVRPRRVGLTASDLLAEHDSPLRGPVRIGAEHHEGRGLVAAQAGEQRRGSGPQVRDGDEVLAELEAKLQACVLRDPLPDSGRGRDRIGRAMSWYEVRREGLGASCFSEFRERMNDALEMPGRVGRRLLLRLR